MGAALLALAAPLPADAGGGVRTTVNGLAGPYLSVGLLHDRVDVPRDTLTTTRMADGEEWRDGRGGTPARRLVALAGLDPVHVLTMAIDRPNTSGSVLLTGVEVTDGFHGDPLGLREATFDPDYNLDPATGLGSEVHFFRPMRNALDVNDSDALDPPKDRDLVVHLTTDGPVLAVSADADPTQASPGTPIHLTASLVPPRSDATFSWDFGDGSAPAAGAEVDHAYVAGSWEPTVTALTHDGAAGAALVHVQVGPPPSDGAGDGTGVGGAVAGAGGGSGGRYAPSEGPRHGGSTASAGGRRAAHGRADARARVHNSSPTSRPHAAFTAGTRREPPPPRPTDATTTSRSSAALHDARRPPSAAAGRPQSPAAPASAESAARVSGVLLAADGATLRAPAAGLVPAPDAQARNAASVRASASASTSQPLGWWLLAGLGLVLLLGLGVARESGVRLTTTRARAS